MRSDNNRIITVLVALSVLFLFLIGYLLCFPLFLSKEYKYSPYNPRVRAEEARILRGSFYDRKGVQLAYSERTEGDAQVRIYPYDKRYAHVIGYCSSVYSRSGLELVHNAELAGIGNFSMAFPTAEYGVDVYTTLDNRLQEKAEALLSDKEGAIVVVNPKNGAVLAMYSSPSFSPASRELEAGWDTLGAQESAPMLNRATQGRYTPGSVFKIVTLCGAIEGGMEGQLFEDTGVYRADGQEIHNAGEAVYGTISLKDAFAKSANTVFADIAVRLGEKNMKKLSRRFGLEEKIPFELPLVKSEGAKGFKDDAELASFGIGQAALGVTPLFMASVVGTIANQGVMMEPYLTEKLVWDGADIYRHKAKACRTVMQEQTAQTIREYMRAVVESGTGMAANSDVATVFGKTGTAENESGQSHAWFVGFAEGQEKDSIAFAVLWAYAGKTGGEVCAPMAKELVSTWFTE